MMISSPLTSSSLYTCTTNTRAPDCASCRRHVPSPGRGIAPGRGCRGPNTRRGTQGHFNIHGGREVLGTLIVLEPVLMRRRDAMVIGLAMAGSAAAQKSAFPGCVEAGSAMSRDIHEWYR